ncbi:hypothetical protein LOTGIDRAFT_168055 [Lottia gigantea]|uniref:Uncharacterized protein n=1 Tax=Lottia gigantea TaxID=225164 RepID=V3Z350_LOTGI|nr:hypothetical protein LOTGIDRAFT_168055 [Lottia gigantea]ESO85038.1 hypothetical protein LOTGIDRAFT_168055 [Lottia gigantea]
MAEMEARDTVADDKLVGRDCYESDSETSICVESRDEQSNNENNNDIEQSKNDIPPLIRDPVQHSPQPIKRPTPFSVLDILSPNRFHGTFANDVTHCNGSIICLMLMG